MSLWNGQYLGGGIGGSRAWVHLEDDVLVEIDIGGTAVVAIKLDSNGFVYTKEGGGGYVLKYRWLLSGAPADYEAYASVSNDPLTTGNVGVWESLGGDLIYELSTTNYDQDTHLTLQVRDVITEIVRATNLVPMTAYSAP